MAAALFWLAMMPLYLEPEPHHARLIGFDLRETEREFAVELLEQRHFQSRSFERPPGGQQSLDFAPAVSIVDEVEHAGVRGRPHYSTRCLHDFSQPREQVRIVMDCTEGRLQGVLHHLVDRIHLWKAQRRDERADHTLAGKIDPFGKRTAK